MLTQLPNDLEDLKLSNNHFSGSLDLTRLPPNMSNLVLNDNSFSGILDLSQLPQGLKQLRLSFNVDLSGEVFISDELFDRVWALRTQLIKRHAE